MFFPGSGMPINAKPDRRLQAENIYEWRSTSRRFDLGNNGYCALRNRYKGKLMNSKKTRNWLNQWKIYWNFKPNLGDFIEIQVPRFQGRFFGFEWKYYKKWKGIAQVILNENTLAVENYPHIFLFQFADGSILYPHPLFKWRKFTPYQNDRSLR